MNLRKINWKEKNYQKYVEYLKSCKDQDYKRFHESILGGTNLELIGIRVPKMRCIAKEILKGNVKEYLEYFDIKYYEELMIYGFVLSSSEEYIDKYLYRFINKIDNWAICDSFCSSLKIVNKKQGKYWIYFTSLIDLEKEFQTRVSIVIMLNYYLNDNYIDRVLNIVSSINSDSYYINMAISWLLSVAIINYQDKVIKLLDSKKLNKFVVNKTISKIQDSYRIDKNVKKIVKKYRVSIK